MESSLRGAQRRSNPENVSAPRSPGLLPPTKAAGSQGRSRFDPNATCPRRGADLLEVEMSALRVAVPDCAEANEKGARRRPFDCEAVKPGYLIFVSLNSTCLRATGSYFLNVSFSVLVRAFFCVT